MVPRRRGLITGLAVAGFGAGALMTAPVVERLISSVALPNSFASARAFQEGTPGRLLWVAALLPGPVPLIFRILELVPMASVFSWSAPFQSATAE